MPILTVLTLAASAAHCRMEVFADQPITTDRGSSPAQTSRAAVSPVPSGPRLDQLQHLRAHSRQPPFTVEGSKNGAPSLLQITGRSRQPGLLIQKRFLGLKHRLVVRLTGRCGWNHERLQGWGPMGCDGHGGRVGKTIRGVQRIEGTSAVENRTCSADLQRKGEIEVISTDKQNLEVDTRKSTIPVETPEPDRQR